MTARVMLVCSVLGAGAKAADVPTLYVSPQGNDA